MQEKKTPSAPVFFFFAAPSTRADAAAVGFLALLPSAGAAGGQPTVVKEAVATTADLVAVGADASDQ